MKYGIKKKNLIPSSPGELNNTTNEHVYKDYTFMGKYGLGRFCFPPFSVLLPISICYNVCT